MFWFFFPSLTRNTCNAWGDQWLISIRLWIFVRSLSHPLFFFAFLLCIIYLQSTVRKSVKQHTHTKRKKEKRNPSQTNRMCLSIAMIHSSYAHFVVNFEDRIEINNNRWTIYRWLYTNGDPLRFRLAASHDCKIDGLLFCFLFLLVCLHSHFRAFLNIVNIYIFCSLSLVIILKMKLCAVSRFFSSLFLHILLSFLYMANRKQNKWIC